MFSFFNKIQLLEPLTQDTRLTFVRFRYYNNRHRDPKYRLERHRKLWKIELPEFHKKEDKNLAPDQIRTKLKEKGIAPPTPWNEREIFLPCTVSTMDPYPSQKSEKGSLSAPVTYLKSLVTDRRTLSQLRNFEGDDFNLEKFARDASEIYIKAHESVARKDEEEIFEYVTEHCFPIMTAGLNLSTVVWKHLGDIAPPETVRVRAGDQLSKGNRYAQITVKMHTRQILAIYDRHGRLVHGSPSDVREVLEYIVFEKHLSNEYGKWRIHDRIRDGELNLPAQLISKTYVVSNK